MPNLEALARRGMRFTRKLAASPVCAPSRACLAAGKEYDGCGVVNNGYDYPAGQTTDYGILRDHGKLGLHKKMQFYIAVLRNLGAGVTNNFAAIVLSSLDGKPLARAGKMLLTAGSRVSNTGLKWNDTRTRVQSQGGSPSLIEPVSGTITLRNIAGATGVSASALDGAGKPSGDAVEARKTADGWVLQIGEPATTWYVISVRRR